MAHRPRLAVPLALAVLAGSSAVSGDVPPIGGGRPPPPPPPAAPSAADVAKGQRDFALDLHRRLVAKGGNVFASPWSVSTALALTTAGAKGATESELRAALHLPAGYVPAFRDVANSIASIPMVDEYDAGQQREVKKPAYALSIANAIFVHRGFAVLPGFRATATKDFLAESRELDFERPPEARRAINEWVAAKTKDRIRDIVPDGLPTPDTRVALANAIHFKGLWEHEFAERGTEDGPFTTGAGAEVVVKRMRRTFRFPTAETETARILELPYKSGETSMVVVLPKAKDGLAALEATATGETFAAWTGALAPKLLDVRFPKFEVTSSFDLVGPLAELGVKAAFLATSADFSGIAPPPPPLFVGAILHKAFVAVDEKGTEAAAATVVMMRAGSAMRPEEPTPFVVDRPFLFAIRHVPTGAILFLGRVDDPTKR